MPKSGNIFVQKPTTSENVPSASSYLEEITSSYKKKKDITNLFKDGNAVINDMLKEDDKSDIAVSSVAKTVRLSMIGNVRDKRRIFESPTNHNNTLSSEDEGRNNGYNISSSILPPDQISLTPSNISQRTRRIYASYIVNLGASAINNSSTFLSSEQMDETFNPPPSKKLKKESLVPILSDISTRTQEEVQGSDKPAIVEKYEEVGSLGRIETLQRRLENGREEEVFSVPIASDLLALTREEIQGSVERDDVEEVEVAGPSVTFEVVPRRVEDGKEVFEEHEFHYYRDRKFTRLILISDLNQNHCYVYGKYFDGMRCTGCQAKPFTSTAKLSDDQRKVYANAHRCEPKNYADVIKSLRCPELICGRSFAKEVGVIPCSSGRSTDDRRRLDDGKEIFGEDEFHYLKVDHKFTRLIIISDLNENQCYSFGKDYNRMRCLSCKPKRTYAYVCEEKKEVYVESDYHVCEPRVYSKEIATLRYPELIFGKPLDIQEDGLMQEDEIVEEVGVADPSVIFEVVPRHVEDGKEVFEEHEFHYFRDYRRFTRLILISDLNQNHCYVYGKFLDGMRCNGCRRAKKGGAYSHAKLSDDQRKVYANAHRCEPKSYADVIKSLRCPELICGRSFAKEVGVIPCSSGRSTDDRRRLDDGKEIFGEHEFHYLKYKHKYTRLIIISDLNENQCYSFGKFGKWGKNRMRCLACQHKGKDTFAFICEEKKEIYVEPDFHVCEPRVYSEEIAKLRYPELIFGKPLNNVSFGKENSLDDDEEQSDIEENEIGEVEVMQEGGLMQENEVVEEVGVMQEDGDSEYVLPMEY